MEYIRTYPKCMPDNICDTMVKYFDHHPNLQFQGYMGRDRTVDLSYKNSMEIYITDQQHQQFLPYLYKAVAKYFKNFPHMATDLQDEKWRIKKYDRGEGVYNWHVDASNKDYASRVLAVIFYLNTVEKGGETSFKLDGKIYKVKPKKGTLLIFPANVCYLHKGNVPISNNKYIMTTFLRFK